MNQRLLLLGGLALMLPATALAYSVSASGRVQYHSRANGDVLSPAPGVQVVLRAGDDIPTVTAITDARGFFSATLSGIPRRRRVELDVLAVSGAGIVKDGSGGGTVWNSPDHRDTFTLGAFDSGSNTRLIVAIGDVILADPSLGYVANGTWRRPGDDLVATSTLGATAHYILDRLRHGARYADPKTRRRVPALLVHLRQLARGPGSGDYWWAAYRGGYITLSSVAGGQGHALNERTILHEYGHFIMDLVGDDDSPGGPHRLTDRKSAALAYSEGWAGYFANAVRATFTGNPDPGGLEDWFERNVANLQNYDHTEGAARFYEGIVQCFLWDLHDEVNTADEPFDRDGNPLEVFRAMGRTRTEDTFFGIIPRAGGRVEFGYYLSELEGLDRTLENLSSYYGHWVEDANEQFGPGAADLWNGTSSRATPIAGDGLHRYRLRGLINRGQQDWYALSLSAADRAALRGHPVVLDVEVLDLSLRGEGSVFIGRPWSRDGQYFDPAQRVARFNVGPLDVGDDGPRLAIEGIRSVYGRYDLRVTIVNGGFAGGPDLAITAPGRMAPPAGVRVVDAPDGRIDLSASVPLPGVAVRAEDYRIDVERSSSSTFSRNQTVSTEYAARVDGGRVRLDRAMRLAGGSHHYFRVRARNVWTGTTSEWTRPGFLVRTYLVPPTPRNLVAQWIEPMSQAEADAAEAREDLENMMDALERGDLGEAERLEERRRLREQFREAQPEGEARATGRWYLVCDEVRPVTSEIEGRRYEFEVSIDGGPFQLHSAREFRFLTIDPLPFGRRYVFRVRAVNHAGASGFSNQVSIGVQLPRYELVPISAKDLRPVTWVAYRPADEAASDFYLPEDAPAPRFEAQRAFPNGKGGWKYSKAIALVDGRLETAKIEPGTYWFRIRPVDEKGPGAYGRIVQVDVAPKPLPPKKSVSEVIVTTPIPIK